MQRSTNPVSGYLKPSSSAPISRVQRLKNALMSSPAMLPALHRHEQKRAAPGLLLGITALSGIVLSGTPATAQSIGDGTYIVASTPKGANGTNGRGGESGLTGCSTEPTAGTAGRSAIAVTQTVDVPQTSGNGLARVASTGGFGGDGGNNITTLRCGDDAGAGGQGGSGASVAVTTNPYTQFTSVATAVVGISTGGVGGDGGRNNNSGQRGGSGGSGGVGGSVNVTTNGVLNTTGADAAPVYAQSVGGRGGAGGQSDGFITGGDGGGAGAAGAGGAVAVANNARLTTQNGIGIFAQSIGGAGGAGGFSYGTFGGSDGGKGGYGGAGGTVFVENNGSISVNGLGSQGIFAQSVGGGGGRGGSTAGAYAIGASGGPAGNAAAVTVINRGDITGRGAANVGIFAQSVGGGGGSGGLGFGSSVDTVGIGGTGGKGGTGDVVFVDNIGRICTGNACETNTAPAGSGGQAYGIFAQSIGGGGGEGGFGGAALVFGRSVSVGGKGGDGGAGGFVSVINAGTIKTNEFQSAGIFAQSVGGGGGVAGGAIALNAGGSATSTTIGGTGGEGGAGGLVAVNCMSGSVLSGRNFACTNAGKVGAANGTTISTRGNNSQAIFAQSVGGGGGAGGFAETLSAAQNVVTETTGGSGAKGGSGGAVYAGTGGGALDTVGNNSAGLFVQSVGGGGGSGGSTVTSTFAVSSFGTSFGGSGAGGGAGGNVTAENQGGRIGTRGDNSAGIFAQSVGGGGGNGGLALTSGAAIAKIDVSFGGSAGGGNNAGAVVVANSGSIGTGGGNSAAILAQSIGGGGGNGGGVINGGPPTAGTGSFAFIAAYGGKAGAGGTGGNGGTVAVNCFVGPASTAANSAACITPFGTDRPSTALSSGSTLSTTGAFSNGILAQSIGGGGGNGGYISNTSAALGASIAATFGGAGAAGGAGGAVYANTAGMTITTAGANSAALLAQSIGGGGGNGGSTLSGTFGGAFDLSTSFGGKGAGGRAGGAVLVENFGGTLRTGGANSVALLAQSIGGGGGNGGNAINAGAAGGVSAKASFGGGGGSGASGGKVTVVNVFDLNSQSTGLSTSGQNSHALAAQSIGGGGGNGGDALAVGAGGVGAIALAFGGGGGVGGTADVVTVVSNNARYATTGDDAKAVLAQSIGGGGGTGGSSISIGVSSIGSAALSFGGAAGAGGRSSLVDVALTGGSLTTSGARSDGVLAQSIGGSGGSGGASVAGAGSLAGVALGLAMGGSGGLGGIGGDVRVANVAKNGAAGASIVTKGFQSTAITAQSIGGNGGQGGFSVAGVASLGGGGAAAVSIGGAGGAGGMSGVVTVDNDGAILGSGGGAALITAQSIGGSGGAGGFSVAGALAYGYSAAVSIGGDGGGGGVANIVTVNNKGAILNIADQVNSGGILAQSIGGGGGSGGFSVAGGLSAFGSLALSIGGDGGGGGAGLAVNVDNRGTIDTLGALSHGIQAQSIGGKGGSGGFSVAGAISQGTGVAIGVGGSGGIGGTAQTVTVTQDLDYSERLLTRGAGSTAILAQSIGGSGGTSGFTVSASGGGLGAVGVSVGGNGGTGGVSGAVVVKATGAGEIKTLGENAIGIIAESIGGSGGNASFSVAGGASSTLTGTANVGGLGGEGGKASTVDVTLGSALRTEGDLATGIYAASIGGNGGTGGDAISGSLAIGNPKLAVGGAGSGAGAGGKGSVSAAVTVTTTPGSIIDTRGQKAVGIIAQSIGGNGGDGGSAYAYSVAISAGGDDKNKEEKKPKSGAASVAVGGTGAGGGDGGVVTVILGGAISTASSLSAGVLAQSIGGSGGNGGSATSKAISGDASASVSVGGGGGDAGNAGMVKLVNTGTIKTLGSLSEGVKAQSVGGGGGSGGMADSEALSNSYAAAVSIGGYGGGGGRGGRVDLTNSGSITTYGDMSSAVFAQSVGGGGGNGGAATSSATGKKDTVPTTGSGSKSGKGGAKVTGSSTATASAPTSSGKPDAATKKDDEEEDNGVAGALSLGGSGGMASEGGIVNVNAAGTITTYGAQSDGIYAQSVGGGGGLGGKATTNAEGGKASAAISLGGSGGGAATGGAVSVISTATIATYGLGSNGIYAQSVGGGGGSGGSTESTAKGGKAAISFGLGGEGGGAGDGGTVTVSNAGTIYSNGVGIFAQSVGGGGGEGGSVKSAATASDEEEDPEKEKKDEEGEDEEGKFDVAAFSGALAGKQSEFKADSQNRAGASNKPAAADPKAKGENGSESAADGGFAVGLSLGGSGGAGGNGGAVSVTSTGNIITRFDAPANSYGIFAQSVGGGGGDAGEAATNTSTTLGSFALALGGSGGKGGSGGRVDVTVGQSIATSAALSAAVFAQSVGGGGGNGGASETTLGDGGKAALAFTMGGTGGDGGSGGAVSVNSTGALTTLGALSHAIFAQSVGGGGGSGGSVVASKEAGDDDPTKAAGEAIAKAGKGDQEAEVEAGVAISVGLGGTGGGGGRGGAVTVASSGTLATGGAGSAGIFAESVGGGGGESGAVTINSDEGEAAVGVALGASGGLGGGGGTVNVTVGSVKTTAELAYGVFAQSVGGGGGSASTVNATSAGGGGVKVNFALGGSGGAGGGGGAVTVKTTGAIATFGSGATGVLAQSVGGGGGSAGASLSSAQIGSVGVALALGGGSAGSGDIVDVNIGSSVSTAGDDAIAILAQSVGGGGGAGTVAESTTSFGGSQKPIVLFKLGGDNGSAGFGGQVNVGVNAPSIYSVYGISTRGSNSPTLLAQSIGGGGGAVLGSTKATGGATSLDVNATLGTFNANFAAGQQVATSLAYAAVRTTGANSAGVVLQSIGGGGGYSASSDVTGATTRIAAKLGQTYEATNLYGGLGNGSGDVSLASTTSAFLTSGVASPAILLQSIAGGGGAFLDTIDVKGATGTAATANLTLGADYAMSSSGNVSLISTGDRVQTDGPASFGIVAQSITGGGGVSILSLPNSGTRSFAGALRLGGGPTTGTTGNVTLKLTDFSLNAGGLSSVGIVAQSIGGGGGIAGVYAGGTTQPWTTAALGSPPAGGGPVNAGGGSVNVALSGKVAFGSSNRIEILAQSIGGGGGLSFSNAENLILGRSSLVESGGTVKITETPYIYKFTSSQTGYVGILAQSIGGGGGVGYFTKNVILGGTPFAAPRSAGNVDVTVTDSITIQSNGAVGVLAQSIGGGGGLAITQEAGTTATLFSGNGYGGDVTVNVNKSIFMTGTYSVGVVAQSVGGGGGAVLTPTGLRYYSGGRGGAVRVNVASGIVVAATGVGGKAIDLRNTTSLEGTASIGDKIALPDTGTATALAQEKIALLATATAATADTPVSTALPSDQEVVIGEGAQVIGGSGAEGTAIEVGEGSTRIVIEKGAIIASLDRTDGGTAIHGASSGSAVTVENLGVIGGDIQLAGNAMLINGHDAMLVTYGRLALGADGYFTNSGTITPGDYGTLQTTTVTGGFGQTASGRLDTDLDLGLLSSGQFTDRISASGSARVGGTVRAFESNVEKIRAGDWFSVLVSAANGVTSESGPSGRTTAALGQRAQVASATAERTLDLEGMATGTGFDLAPTAGGVAALADTVRNVSYTKTLAEPSASVTNEGVRIEATKSAIADFSLVTSGTQLSLRAHVDFATPGRTQNVNRTATGDYFNRIQDAGSAPVLADTVRGLFYTQTAAALAAVYDSYNGDIYADQLAAATYAADRFSTRMISCRSNGAVSEDGCAWASVGNVDFRQNANVQDFRFQETGTVFQAGLEHRLGQSAFFAGISGGYETVTSSTNGANGNGDRYLAGLLVGWRPGRAEIALYGSIGAGNIDVVRPVAAPGGTVAASGSQRFDFGQYGGVASYRFDLAGLSVRPSVEAGYAQYELEGFTERGAGPLSLAAQSGTSDGVGFVRPRVAMTRLFDLGGVRIEPSLSAAYTRRLTDRVTFRSRFVGAPTGVAAMTTASFLDRDSGNVTAGISAVTSDGLRLSGEYGITFGDRTRDQSVQAKLSIAF